MNEQLDESYLTWLYGQHSKVRRTASLNTHWKLSNQLFRTEFVWFVPNDDNRVEDGRRLRIEYIEASGLTDVDPEWFKIPCSVLEMLIGLSRRLAFETDGRPKDWFWHILENLKLLNCQDKEFDSEYVSAVVDRLVWRTYEKNGEGGLFPLRNPSKDQTHVEIWYQMCDYLLEHR